MIEYKDMSGVVDVAMTTNNSKPTKDIVLNCYLKNTNETWLLYFLIRYYLNKLSLEESLQIYQFCEEYLPKSMLKQFINRVNMLKNRNIIKDSKNV